MESWQTMRIALEQGWGDEEKRTMLASEVVDAYDLPDGQKIPDEDEIEDLLLQAMEEEFNCVVDDGSARTVAGHITQIWKDVGSGQGLPVILALEGAASKLSSQRVQATSAKGEADSSEDEDDEDDKMDAVDEAPTLIPVKRSEAPQVDDEGFTLVKGRGRI